MVHPLVNTTDPSRRTFAEGDVSRATDIFHGLKVPRASIRLVAGCLADSEVLGGRLDQRREVWLIIGVLILNDDGGDNVGSRAAHAVRLGPPLLRFHLAMLHAVPPLKPGR